MLHHPWTQTQYKISSKLQSTNQVWTQFLSNRAPSLSKIWVPLKLWLMSSWRMFSSNQRLFYRRIHRQSCQIYSEIWIIHLLPRQELVQVRRRISTICLVHFWTGNNSKHRQIKVLNSKIRHLPIIKGTIKLRNPHLRITNKVTLMGTQTVKANTIAAINLPPLNSNSRITRATWIREIRKPTRNTRTKTMIIKTITKTLEVQIIKDPRRGPPNKTQTITSLGNPRTMVSSTIRTKVHHSLHQMRVQAAQAKGEDNMMAIHLIRETTTVTRALASTIKMMLPFWLIPNKSTIRSQLRTKIKLLTSKSLKDAASKLPRKKTMFRLWQGRQLSPLVCPNSSSRLLSTLNRWLLCLISNESVALEIFWCHR